MSTPPPNAIDISTLPASQLSNIQARLSSEVEALSVSHAQLRSAQSRFRDCIRTIEGGLGAAKGESGDAVNDSSILVPLTSSLYVPGRLASRDTVIVDIGTGFYVEKTTKAAIKFYTGKVDDLARNLSDLEKVIGGKSENVRVVEDVLRQKVMQGELGAPPG